MSYKDQTNITINKELRAKLYELKEKYGVSWKDLLEQLIVFDQEEE